MVDSGGAAKSILREGSPGHKKRRLAAPFSLVLSIAYSGILADPMPKWTALNRPSGDELAKLTQAKMQALLDRSDELPE